MENLTQPQKWFITGFIDALLWASVIEIEGEAYNADELNEESKEVIKRQCLKFIEENSQLLAEYVTYIVPNEWNAWERAGHDFALTRNGHGVGYWDRDYKDSTLNKDVDYIGKELTEACRQWGEMNVYIGNDDKLHVSVLI